MLSRPFSTYFATWLRPPPSLDYSLLSSPSAGGIFENRDMSQVTNGYLETIIDWVPAMKNIRLRDFPSFIRTTNAEDFMVNFALKEVEAIPRAKALILNTFDALEQDVLDALFAMFPRIYTVGPLQLMMNYINDNRLNSMSSSLWKEDSDCIKWLDDKDPKSVVYVNFGSVTVVTAQQLTEFAWGLANSKKSFLWIVRPDIVEGESAMLPPEFVEDTKDRSKLISWCPQEQTNCRFSCVDWEIGMEIDNDVKRDDVELMVKEMMDGEKGKKMKEKATEWKRKAEEAVELGGSSYLNLNKLINEVL
ncbi:hypothetical protein BUALT_Bualt19G0080500 [Buddleja alternifolia]|uniref:Uncharacterized protein n=1 Tax=Buddleja alternifolia TaxID=168488 RepID=A0AAV6W6B8_9LAMI|nr:hypothetical protein BUALT_Bualt19G0080500 [Buddleja alternifolia]